MAVTPSVRAVFESMTGSVARQELVGALVNEHFVLSQLREDLGQVRDIERTVTRLSQGGGNARDLSDLSCQRLFEGAP